MKSSFPVIALIVCLLAPLSARALTMDFVTVGNPGNAADTTGFGAVANTFAIGTYEVTNTQYAEFLNTVDPTGANALGLYNTNMGSNARGGINVNLAATPGERYELKLNMGNKPVNFVSFWDATRFTNWMHNGMGAASSTEIGAYTLTLIGISNNTVTRNAGAIVWIPSEDEWYKAAYHDPVNPGADGSSTTDYWIFQTQSDTAPTAATASATGDISNPGTNVANYSFGANWNGLIGNVTTVGTAGVNSQSHYGTSDQAGNVWEWNDTMVTSSTRGVRGGSYGTFSDDLRSSTRNGITPTLEFVDVGFRVASVPEPTVVGMLTLGALLLLSKRQRIARFRSPVCQCRSGVASPEDLDLC